MPDSYIEKILSARVYDVAQESALDSAPLLSQRLNNRVLLKREDQQAIFSFKLRGAYNKLFRLSVEDKARGVIAASAGNHAQGVALAARELGIVATIVMPSTTPPIKIDAVRALGAQAVLHGDSFDEAYEYSLVVAKQQDLVFVHPFDDPDVIAGQGTIGMEICRQHPDALEAVFIPVGGGGLIAGISTYMKYLRPEAKIIGVEPEDAPTLYTALQSGERAVLDHVGIFADGVAVRQIGEENFRIARKSVDEVVLTTTDEICAAIKDIFDDTRSLSEPAGALATAGLKKYVQRERIEGKNLIAINSGANMNFDRLRHVAERAELGEQREALLAVTIPERPGAFRQFCRIVGNRSVTEFNYRYGDSAKAHIFVGIELREASGEKNALMKDLSGKGYPVLDMTDNEMAKLHLRHMVGGHSPEAVNEIIYRFEFPERPGALLRFLDAIGQAWNISLFHYRNHGAAYGRVLVGMQVPEADMARFRASLDELGYPYWDETANPVYGLFLGRPGR
ncbi:MAG: threonine ammonia-lyase, biosynthetic [Gammaproteobacteria bacterium]